MSFVITARGHRAVLSTHPTTLEITTDRSLTTRADCVVAVESSHGLADLPSEVKRILSSNLGRGILILKVGDHAFTVHARGSHALTLSHPRDIVVRRSGFISERTLMVHSDKAAADIPRAMVKLLQNPEEEISIEIHASLQAQS
ncbi:hypothetical protein AUG19_05190 [archaeon 13_1_20CM_2_54_9]|nr:MAG: hypothetical protein AUG19_05190 [archaeon 13_1_20CM_2_54_9]